MKKNKFESKLSANGPSYQPLYKQVEEYVTQLIVEQRWKPGEMLPNEFQLADELKVSQGTVRKALNTLTANKILERRQGVGTFVSERTSQNALYKFFPIVADGKTPELPMSETLSRKIEIASGIVAENLHLEPNEEVIVLSRKRKINNELCILEDIYLPKKYFSGLMEEVDIPHTLLRLYCLLQVYESDKNDAKQLNISIGEPLIAFTRLAHSLEGKLIEFRITRCKSDNYHYCADLM